MKCLSARGPQGPCQYGPEVATIVATDRIRSVVRESGYALCITLCTDTSHCVTASVDVLHSLSNAR